MSDALRRAVTRASLHPWTLAAVLGTDLDAVAAQLGTDQDPVSVRQAALLLLCRQPRPDRWDHDVDELAAFAGVDRERLAAVLTADAVMPHADQHSRQPSKGSTQACEDRYRSCRQGAGHSLCWRVWRRGKD